MEASQSNKRSRGSVRQISHSSSEDPFSDKSKSNVVTPKGVQRDSRSTEQRVLDIHCTFQPTLLTSSHRRKVVEGSKLQKSSSDSNAYIVSICATSLFSHPTNTDILTHLLHLKNDSLGSLALDSSSATEGEYFYGENLIDVYKANPYDSINGKNTTDGRAPVVDESTATSKLAAENRVKNDFKSQAGIEKCLAHLRRGKDKREEDLKHTKSLELRNYDPINGKSSDINIETDLDMLKKNDGLFTTEVRKNSKSMKELASPCRDYPWRSPTQRLTHSGDATPISRGSASPACRSPSGPKPKSFRAAPPRKSSVSFGSCFIPEPRESLVKPSRKASSTPKSQSSSPVTKSTAVAKPRSAVDQPIDDCVPLESSVFSLFPSVLMDLQETTPDRVATERIFTPDSVSVSPSPVSHYSEKSLQSKDFSVMSQGSKGPGGKSKARSTSASPTSRRTASPPKTIGSPPKVIGSSPKNVGTSPKINGSPTKTNVSPPKTTGSSPKITGSPPKITGSPAKNAGSPRQLVKSPVIRKAHQKLIGKYQNILAIDVDRFDGSADTFKSLIDLKQ